MFELVSFLQNLEVEYFFSSLLASQENKPGKKIKKRIVLIAKIRYIINITEQGYPDE